MKMNDFLKKIASDMKTNGRMFHKEDFYYILKYVGVKKDVSLANDIEKFYEDFLDSLNDSLVRFQYKKIKEGENATHYIGFYVDKKANYLERVKVYFPVKYSYMISSLKTIFLYLIRNNILSIVKFHVKSTNENIVIEFYHSEDVKPFIDYCNHNFILNDLLLNPNPFIATTHQIGIVKDSNQSTYIETLSILLEEYFRYLASEKAFDLASDLDFLDYVIKREANETNESMLFTMKSIENSIRSIMLSNSPLD